jgi:hypothetical protein
MPTAVAKLIGDNDRGISRMYHLVQGLIIGFPCGRLLCAERKSGLLSQDFSGGLGRSLPCFTTRVYWRGLLLMHQRVLLRASHQRHTQDFVGVGLRDQI